MDAADITALNDFNDESVAQQLNRLRTSKPKPVLRGVCLYCKEKIEQTRIYCDSECKEGFEKQEQILRRTRR